MTKNKNKIPTIIAILFLTLGLSVSVLLTQQTHLLFPSAKQQLLLPQDVRISNVTESSFTVTWLTQEKSKGQVIWGKSNKLLNKTTEEDFRIESYTHYVNINNLEPETTYYFKIKSGNALYGNKDLAWEVKTAPRVSSENSQVIKNISGSVVDTLGKPAAFSLVFVKTDGSNLLSTYTSENGNWIIPLNNIRVSDLESLFLINGQELIEIEVQAGPIGMATARIYANKAVSTPIITLGRDQDFTDIKIDQKEDTNPKSEILTPQEEKKQPKFDTNNYSSTPESNKLSIDSIEEGEIIYTTRPEFFGKGPVNNKITVILESDNPQTETLNTDKNGNWRWNPSINLSPGQHKITLTYRDKDGVLKSVVKNFFVQAAEIKEPSFESTPSASLTPKPLPTIEATNIPSSESGIPAQPSSGVSLPTIILFGLGILLFITSGVLLSTN